MQISVFESAALQGTVLALKGMDRDLAAQIRKATKDVSQAEWTKDLARHASTTLENKVLVDTARVTVSNQNITLKAGQLKKKLHPGGPARSLLTPSVEWGSAADRNIKSTSSLGKPYTRKQGSTFRARNRKGYVAHQAAAGIIPRIASLWVQTTVRTFHEAIEKGTR